MFVLVEKTDDGIKTNYLVTNQNKFCTRELENAIMEVLSERIEMFKEDDEKETNDFIGQITCGFSADIMGFEYYWEELMRLI